MGPGLIPGGRLSREEKSGLPGHSCLESPASPQKWEFCGIRAFPGIARGKAGVLTGQLGFLPQPHALRGQ